MWPKLSVLTAILISSGALAAPHARAAEAEPNLPLCLKTDTRKWWESAYCQTKAKTDSEAPAFEKCRLQYRKNKAVPRPTCRKIRWLKARTCAAWKNRIKPEEYTECLRAKGFPKRVDDNREYFYGAGSTGGG